MAFVKWKNGFNVVDRTCVNDDVVYGYELCTSMHMIHSKINDLVQIQFVVQNYSL